MSIESSQGPWLDVVGVAKSGTYNLPGERPQGYLYLPFAQNYRSMQVVHVHSEGNPLALLPAIRQHIHELDAELPLFDVKTMETHIRQGKGTLLFQLGSGLVGAFGLVGLVLAAIGLYGVISYSVGRRTHEIGIRLALGATPGKILGMVLGHGLVLALAGVALGLLGAAFMTRFYDNLLIGVTAIDAATFSALGLLMMAAIRTVGQASDRPGSRGEPERRLPATLRGAVPNTISWDNTKNPIAQSEESTDA